MIIQNLQEKLMKFFSCHSNHIKGDIFDISKNHCESMENHV